MTRVLLVDDEAAIREQVGEFLAGLGFEVLLAPDGETALRLAEGESADIALVDYRMPGMDGVELIRRLRELDARLVVIMMTAHGTVERAVEAMQAGARDFLTKPVEPAFLESKLRFIAEKLEADAELLSIRRLLQGEDRFDDLIGQAPAMRAVFERLRSAADSDFDVLISGETGTGKELAARAIHFGSRRKDGPFVAVSCAAVPESLVESELFGHVRGAFTGAMQRRDGRFVSAHGGTLLLDELSASPAAFQAKLLRVLEERRVTAVGGDADRAVDVRVIATMNVDPEQALEDGSLRADLFYRLNVLHIALPPLRERRGDIPLLVHHFVRGAASGREPPAVTPAYLAALTETDWPGNVRELKHAVESAVAFGGGELGAAAALRGSGQRDAAAPTAARAPAADASLREVVEQAEADHLRRVLDATGGAMREAAARLGIDERSLRRKVARHGIDRRDFADDD